MLHWPKLFKKRIVQRERELYKIVQCLGVALTKNAIAKGLIPVSEKVVGFSGFLKGAVGLIWAKNSQSMIYSLEIGFYISPKTFKESRVLVHDKKFNCN